MYFRPPVWPMALGQPGAQSFALLFAFESFARATISTVVPLQVLDVTGDPQNTSTLLFFMALIGISGNLAVPLLVRVLSRRFTFTLGCLMLVATAFSFAEHTLASTALGLFLRVFSASCSIVCLNLYILDHLHGRELNKIEPLRLFLAGFAWTLGPWLGVHLSLHYGHAVPFLLAACAALLCLAYFWYLRITDNPVIVRARSAPPNPFKAIGVYFRQPRLRLAWLIAMIRTAWWATFYTYGPIFAVTAGLGREAGGLMVSAASALLFFSPFYGRVLQRKGVRWLVIRGFLVAGGVTLTAALLSPITPAVAAAVLVLAACAVAALDVAGNLPFLRTVRPSQRAPMTSVFLTYRDAATIAPQGLFSVLLRVLPLPFVFVASGLSLLTLAWYSRFLPRRL